jgi:hypothetical protein
MSRKPEDLPIELSLGCSGLEHPGGSSQILCAKDQRWTPEQFASPDPARSRVVLAA